MTNLTSSYVLGLGKISQDVLLKDTYMYMCLPKEMKGVSFKGASLANLTSSYVLGLGKISQDVLLKDTYMYTCLPKYPLKVHIG